MNDPWRIWYELQQKPTRDSNWTTVDEFFTDQFLEAQAELERDREYFAKRGRPREMRLIRVEVVK